MATIYPGDVNGSPIVKAPLTVSIPDGAPTGQVFNPTNDFVAGAVLPKGPARFIFSTESGHIAAWNPATPPTPQPTTAEHRVLQPDRRLQGLGHRGHVERVIPVRVQLPRRLR